MYQRSQSWQTGLLIQARVIKALMIRDALSRYGHDNLGFFWVIGEPLLLTCGIMIVWSLMGASHGGEVGVIPFALTGYTFISMWRHIVSRSQRVMSANSRLSYHRHVKHLDVIIANAAMELVAIFTAFIVSFLPLWLLGFSPGFHDPLALVSGYFFTAWFAFSFGLVLAGLSEFTEVMHHIIPPLMYMTLPITGSFFMVEWLPVKLQAFMTWSPLVNCIEMIRGGLFPEDVTTHWSATYLIVCCSVLSAVGLILCRIAEKRVQST